MTGKILITLGVTIVLLLIIIIILATRKKDNYMPIAGVNRGFGYNLWTQPTMNPAMMFGNFKIPLALQEQRERLALQEQQRINIEDVPRPTY